MTPQERRERKSLAQSIRLNADGRPKQTPPQSRASLMRPVKAPSLESEIKSCGDKELQDFAKRHWDRTWKNLFDIRLDMTIARKRGVR